MTRRLGIRCLATTAIGLQGSACSDPGGDSTLFERGDSAGVEMGQPQRWEILSSEGVWLGSMELPERFTVMDIELDAVLGIWRDELDVQHPQVLGLDRGR